VTAVEDQRERGRELAVALAADGVAGLIIAWADNNGIPRSRTVPVAALPEVAATGVGVTTLFAVFDTNDAITFAAPGLQTPSGDLRLVPQLDRITRLAGQPAFAWAPGKQVTAEGGPWAFDQRSVLERTIARLDEAGYSALVGYEMEFAVYEQPQDTDDDVLVPAHPGPAYSPHALLPIDDFVAAVMRDAEANGLRLGQVHAEYGPAQVELSLAATDPLTAADQQAFLAATSLPRYVEKGECLIEQGEDAAELMMLCRGMTHTVRTLADGKQQIVAVSLAGDFLNSGGVLFRQARNSIFALTPAICLSLPFKQVEALARTRPAIAHALWLETAAQAAIQQEWMVWLGRRAAQTRLAHFLCEVTYRLQLAGIGTRGEFEFPLTQRELADLLGLSAVHVNRTLQILRGQNLVELNHQRLKVCNREGLYEVAEFDPRYLEGPAFSAGGSI